MTSTDAQTLFDRAAKRLSGVERGKMLSASGLRDPGAGKFFAFVTRGQLVVKLPAERVTELIAGSAVASLTRARIAARAMTSAGASLRCEPDPTALDGSRRAHRGGRYVTGTAP